MDSRQSRCLLSGVGLHSLLVYSISHTLSSEICTSAKLFSGTLLRFAPDIEAGGQDPGGSGGDSGGVGRKTVDDWEKGI